MFHALDTRDPIGRPPVRRQRFALGQLVGRQGRNLPAHGFMRSSAALTYTILCWLQSTGEPPARLEKSRNVCALSQVDRIHAASTVALAK